MTLEEAMRHGHTSLRKAHWREARLELDHKKGVDGRPKYGAWATLVAPPSEQHAFSPSQGQLSLLIEGDDAQRLVVLRAAVT